MVVSRQGKAVAFTICACYMLGFSGAQVQSSNSAAGRPPMQTGEHIASLPYRQAMLRSVGWPKFAKFVFLSSVSMCHQGSHHHKNISGISTVIFTCCMQLLQHISNRLSRASESNVSDNTTNSCAAGMVLLFLNSCVCVKSTFTAVAISHASHECSADPSAVPELEPFLICFVLNCLANRFFPY